MLKYIYLNSFSLGSLIAITFFLMTSLFLLSIRDKSKATLHLGLGYLFMAIFNCGYLISSTIYHPIAAYHRWLTVLTILITQTYIIKFMFHFPDDRAPRVGKAFFIISYSISLIIAVLFCVATLKVNKIYLFNAHYWDFDADYISKLVSYQLILNNLIILLQCLWRFFIQQGRERLVIILFFFLVCIATVLPSLANTLSRDGLIGRDIFQNTWVLCNVLGFFGIFLVYVNNAKDRISFLGKLIGVSLVAMLAMLQLISYFLLNEKDQSYDDFHRQLAATVVSGGKVEGTEYHAIFTFKQNRFDYKGEQRVAPEAMRADCVNAYLMATLQQLDPNLLMADPARSLKDMPYSFSGYRNAIVGYLVGLPEGEKDPLGKVTLFLESIRRKVIYAGTKIRQLPDENFRERLQAFIAKPDEKLAPFYTAVSAHLEQSQRDGAELKAEVLPFFTPVYLPGARYYRSGINGSHYISYLQPDVTASAVHEVGFSYPAYRAYMHPTVLKFILILVGVVVVVRFVFQFFFLGILVNPLRALSHGVRRIDQGDLEVTIPVRIADEIGIISQSFNTMAATLRRVVETILQNSAEVKNVSSSLDEASESLANIARELTAIVEQTAASYEQMSSTFEESLSNIKIQLESSEEIKSDIENINTNSGHLKNRITRLTESINSAVSQVEAGEKTMNKTVSAIEELAKYLRDIEGTINSINEVADKINLLALNAAIEAARAGEQGRGFAVVADEVNKLADQTTQLVSGIQHTIIEHANRIQNELRFISSTATIFSDVRAKIMETRDVLGDTINFTDNLGTMNTAMESKINRLGEISHAVHTFSLEQKNVIDELTRAINTISELSQKTLENADMVRSFSRIVDYGATELTQNIESFTKKENKQ